jgi:hypothetical protein
MLHLLRTTDTGKEANKSADHFDTSNDTDSDGFSGRKHPTNPIMIDGKEVDLKTVEYEMQDVPATIYLTYKVPDLRMAQSYLMIRWRN